MTRAFFAQMTAPDIVNAFIALLALVAAVLGLILQWVERAPRLRVQAERSMGFREGDYDASTDTHSGGSHQAQLDLSMLNDGRRSIEVVGGRSRWIFGRERRVPVSFFGSSSRINPDDGLAGSLWLGDVRSANASALERLVPVYRVSLLDILGRRWKVGYFWITSTE